MQIPPHLSYDFGIDGAIFSKVYLITKGDLYKEDGFLNDNNFCN